MKKTYNIVYFVLMSFSIIYVIFFYNKNESTLIILAAILFIMTSIFTYSNRKK